jgi:hypothetical protein
MAIKPPTRESQMTAKQFNNICTFMVCMFMSTTVFMSVAWWKAQPKESYTYTAGVGCMINMTAEDNVNMEMNNRYIQCTLRHQEYLDSLQVQPSVPESLRIVQ